MTRYRWWVGLAITIAIVGGIALLLRRGQHRSNTDLARKILPIVDQQFQQCVFGIEVPAADLGRYEVVSQITGAVDARRVHSCAEVVKTKLDGIVVPHDDSHVAALTEPIVADDSSLGHAGFGVCAHIAELRNNARTLGIEAPAPDCQSHRDRLEGVVELDASATAYAYRDRLAVVEGRRDLRVRRTQDGTTWDESPPTMANDLHITGATDAFGYAPPSNQENARYVVLDGDKWHVGTFVVGGVVVGSHRTANGWTIVTVRPAQTPVVLQLDPLMDHVTKQTLVPALREKWSHDGMRALIDKQGNVGLVLATTAGDHVVLQTHFVSVDGKLTPPTTTTIPTVVTELKLHACRAPTVEFLAVANAGTLLTTDQGRTFTPLRDGKVGELEAFACTDDHFFSATKRQFASCDHQACSRVPMPVPRDVDGKIAINVQGEQPRVFVSYEDVAMLAAPSATGDSLQVTKSWRIKETGIPPVARIDGLWFAP